MIATGLHDRSPAGSARNVILLVGDGMGQAHRFAAQLATVGLHRQLLMDRLPVAGLMRTTSADPSTFVTDSAAAATAMATGVKTYNGAISLAPDRRPLPTVLEIARWAGKATGLITTCQVTDATPAAFGAHVPQRADQSEIARQFIEESRVDVILGGGEAYWYPAGEPGAIADPGDKRQASHGTAGDLVARARDLGYAHASTPDGLWSAVSGGAEKVLGLFANQELFIQGAEGTAATYAPQISLADLTRAALTMLNRNPHGFFLMVEEAAIDRMAHRNNAALTLRGVQALDAAVAVALDFADDNPETLVVVAADHETGGLAVTGPEDPAYPYEIEEPNGEESELAGEDGPFAVVGGNGLRFVVGWTTTGHTAAAVPVTAAGPGADRFDGSYENTALFEAMVEAMGLGARVR